MWKEEQTSGKLYDPAGVIVGFGYSGGFKGAVPEAVNNPTYENDPNVGPLPAGNYTADYLRLDDPLLGHFVIHLAPDAVTADRIASYGRDPDSFFMHGDDIRRPGQRAASDGCLIYSLDVRRSFWRSSDHDLQVVALLDPLTLTPASAGSGDSGS